MSKIISQKKLTEKLTLTECKDGFWLYDKQAGMNLGMREKTEEDAFVRCISYYQKRLEKAENDLKSLQLKVDSFLSQFKEEDEGE